MYGFTKYHLQMFFIGIRCCQLPGSIILEWFITLEIKDTVVCMESSVAKLGGRTSSRFVFRGLHSLPEQAATPFNSSAYQSGVCELRWMGTSAVGPCFACH